MTDDFFRNRLDQMIDLRHPLVVLANRMPWQEIEASLAQRWGETSTWQYFSGNEYFERRWPCDPPQLKRFRQLLGEEGVEELLACTMEAAQANGIELKQTYAKEGRDLRFKTGRYAHARQFRRMRKAIKRHRTILGRLQREVGCKMTVLSQAVQESLGHTLDKAQRLIAQAGSHQAVDNRAKLYNWHAPEVECFSKGKRRNPYEFGVKVILAMTLRGNLIVGARSFPGNPYDGHILHEQIEQSTTLMQGLGVKPEKVHTDQGYREVDQDNPDIEIKHRGKDKRLTDEERQLLRRRQAIDPIIGHLKSDHRMERFDLKDSQGDALHAALCAAGYNIRWLLCMIAKKGLGLLLCLWPATGWQAIWQKLTKEALNQWLRGRIAALRGARSLAYLLDMSRSLRSGRLALHPARRLLQRFPKLIGCQPSQSSHQRLAMA